MTRRKAYATLIFGMLVIAATLFNLISAFVTGRTQLPRSSGNLLDREALSGSTEFGVAALYNLFAVAVGVGCLFAFAVWWIGQDRERGDQP
jgi:hypothetical protein